MRAFWNSMLTERSWEILQNLSKKYDFIVIGGWAAYLWTKRQKSKDIDIAVKLNELENLKQENLIKNDRLKKYEIKFEDIDVDIYVEYFSDLPIPIKNLSLYCSKVEGFRVVNPEALLVLKQAAEKNRENSVKGEKDRLDILSLLFFSDFSFSEYKNILKKYGKGDYFDRMSKLVKKFHDFNSLGLTPKEFKVKKSKILKEIKKF